MIEIKTYNFRNEFCKKLHIPANQINNRRDELLEWLKGFYRYEISLNKRPITITVLEVYGEYKPMPKHVNQKEQTQEKIDKYEKFTIAALGPTFKPNSKTKIARDAIDDFGYEQFGHTSAEAVARRYIKEPFDKYGETDNKYVWVYFSNYEPMDPAVVSDWHVIMNEFHIGEKQASLAFYKHAQGEDVTEELANYQQAMDMFKEKYYDIPVVVKRWKLKTK